MEAEEFGKASFAKAEEVEKALFENEEFGKERVTEELFEGGGAVADLGSTCRSSSSAASTIKVAA